MKSVMTTCLVAVLSAQLFAQQRANPPWLDDVARRRIVLTVPGMKEARVTRNVAYRAVEGTSLLMDVYRRKSVRSSDRLHAVIFIHGGCLPANLATTPKDWGDYQSLGELVAANGLVGIAFNHRFFESWDSLQRSQDDLEALLAFLQKNAARFNIDPKHLTLWAFSGGGPLLTSAICSPRQSITSLVNYFGILDLKPFRESGERISDETVERFSPVSCMAASPAHPPILIARAGKDRPTFNASVDAFVSRALERNLSITLVNHANGRHGFEIYDDDDRSREILLQTVEFIKRH
ncbi:MAG: alpha/beta hydrolase [Acidobacteria bacterium]|nr:alpha/beta hydrolase [Acidobacteriota bacterium]